MAEQKNITSNSEQYIIASNNTLCIIADFIEMLKHIIANNKLIIKNTVRLIISLLNKTKRVAPDTNNKKPTANILTFDSKRLL